MIEVQNLVYQYEMNSSDYIFNNLSLKLEKGSFTTLVGPIGSGKSTLVKILVGFIKVDSYIKIDELVLCNSNIKQIRTRIGVIFEDPDEIFVSETVMDEIAFALENQNKSKKEIWKKIEEIADYVGIKSLLECDPHTLSEGEKRLVSLASALVIDPQIIILDEALSMLDEISKRKIFNILRECNKKGITILNITHDLNESLYGNDIVLLQNGNVLLQGVKEEVLKQEVKLKRAGLELPFLADLSIRLMYYGVLDHMILDMNEMVDAIWK
ncbi:MAG: ATP-binding cassette domain-containing protein [Bacilli bacterium]|jgi:energy-coupling factor transport system ATP-binding protein|nr:ATP-binding cassette domain-containing protein [Bacilli bacterium]